MKNGLQIQLIADEPSSRGMAPTLTQTCRSCAIERAVLCQKQSCKSGGLRYLARSFMAKTSWINRNARKRATVKKYAAVRAELKAKKDYAGLAQLPRDASPTRVVNRCEVTGRRRAFIRRFKVSRLTFRELASQGLIPGVTKSSW
jgi:small subunit ribosomal protein S14